MNEELNTIIYERTAAELGRLKIENIRQEVIIQNLLAKVQELQVKDVPDTNEAA